MDRKTSRKICWTASSASASLRRIRLAIPKMLEACRSNRTVKASAFPLCKSLARASSDRNLCLRCPRMDIPAGVASVAASETHAPEKSAALGGTSPNTSLAIRELTLSSQEQSCQQTGLLYVYARKEPGLPHRYRIFLLVRLLIYCLAMLHITDGDRSQEHSGNPRCPARCGFLAI